MQHLRRRTEHRRGQQNPDVLAGFFLEPDADHRGVGNPVLLPVGREEFVLQQSDALKPGGGQIFQHGGQLVFGDGHQHQFRRRQLAGDGREVGAPVCRVDGMTGAQQPARENPAHFADPDEDYG